MRRKNGIIEIFVFIQTNVIINKIMSKYFYENIPLPDYNQLVNCMHCGMCLPTCPTYELTGLEKYSPRGRIRMIKAVADEELPITDNFVESINFCLDCQACVTACPAGVKYGQLVEAARYHIEAENTEKGKIPLIKKIALNWIFIDLKKLRWMRSLMKIYQKIGLQSIVQKIRLLKLFSNKLHELSFMALEIKDRKSKTNSILIVDKKNIKIGIVTGCVQDVFFRNVNIDTEEVFRINGYDVFIPPDQQCCGSVHGHNGDLKTAKSLAKKMIDTFDKAGVDFVVLNSAGCGSFMKEYDQLLIDDPEYAQRARFFVEKVKDISEILVEHGWTPSEKSLDAKVTYHDPCHLVHAQQIKNQPRELINNIKGIKFYELPESTWCCGSAGIYNITHYEDSMKLLKRKMENISSTEAEYVITGNPGCMIQLIYGSKKYKKNIKVLHPITLIRKSYN
jgi:glycolate oxidase iron-sulfur subunit